MSFIRGPLAPEANPPINPQYYLPRSYPISGITLGQTTLVTTIVPHDYVIGQLTRLLIPFAYKANQLNEQTGYVVSIPAANQVVLNLYSLNSDAFVPNASSSGTMPQIVAVGDVNTGVINITGRITQGTFIPGSFIDISPA